MWFNSDMKPHDLTGKRFNRLVAIRPVGKSHNRHVLWEVKCDCGKVHVVASDMLKSGHAQSCGCLRQELSETKGADNLRKLNTTHGMSGPLCDRDLTWVSWSMMIQRTSNPKRKEWMDYGGRGIVPCEFIRATPVNLIALIGPRMSRTYSLDRIDNNRGYHCGQCAECVQKGFSLNVRWATKKQQNNNKRNIRMITIDGVTKSEQEWCELLKVSVGTIRNEYHYPLPKIRRREPGIEFTYEI